MMWRFLRSRINSLPGFYICFAVLVFVLWTIIGDDETIAEVRSVRGDAEVFQPMVNEDTVQRKHQLEVNQRKLQCDPA